MDCGDFIGRDRGRMRLRLLVPGTAFCPDTGRSEAVKESGHTGGTACATARATTTSPAFSAGDFFAAAQPAVQVSC